MIGGSLVTGRISVHLQEKAPAGAFKGPADAAISSGLAKRLVNCYAGEITSAAMVRAGAVTAEKRKKQRQLVWDDLADAHPEFKEKLLRIKKMLDDVEIAREGYPAVVPMQFPMYFRQTQDQLSRQLLADVLFGRVSTTSGINREHNIESEAAAMLQELGVDPKSPGMAALDAAAIMDKILSGALRIGASPTP